MSPEFKPPHPFEIQIQFDLQLIEEIKKIPGSKPWNEGISPISLLSNSASHDSDETAFKLMVTDIINALKLKTPYRILNLAIHNALNWREILIDEKGRLEWPNMHPITAESLKAELKAKGIHDAVIDSLF